MFGFFASQNRKMRTTASNWIEMADTVWAYRRDVITESDRKELRARTEDLRQKVKSKADAAELKLSIEALEPVLQRLGGKIYPKTTIIDNVEFFLVAAIVLLGFRAFIAQPFKIPTNSMWPSYYGMTADNLLTRNEDPGFAGTAFRFVAFGAFRHEATAAQPGELSFRILPDGNLAWTLVNGTKWLVIPTQYREYTFYIDNTEARVRIPVEFDKFDQIVKDTLYGGSEQYDRALAQAEKEHRIEKVRVQARQGSADSYNAFLVHTGKKYAAGQDILRFDILAGDQLFVDRISYHFVQPSVGDGFVFRTGNISGIRDQEGRPMDQYYVKRLVGRPGDKLEIREPVLYRNGAPITGASAFAKNNARQAPYMGYFDATSEGRKYTQEVPWLKRGQVVTVPQDGYFALGDNSGNSADGRFWGFVPAKDIVGRPLFVFFPFTNRVGGAR